MKNVLQFALCSYLLLSFYSSHAHNSSTSCSLAAITIQESRHNAAKINLIYNQNSSGLSKDGEILIQEFQKLGYAVNKIKSGILKPIPKADINVFLEQVDQFFFSYANKNYLIPNPEWYVAPADLISQFDMILCKTRESERIFKPLNPNTIFISFTSPDPYDENVKKDFRKALHVAGSSLQKGTKAVLETWSNNPNFPRLLLLKNKGQRRSPHLSNLKFIYKFIEDSKLKHIQNTYGIHLCPSETEGFGHYIMEALGCGAVVITTDAPPMNEFVLDKRCLASYLRTSNQRLATNYYVDPSQLAEVIDTLMGLTDSELQVIGKKNREFYLENKRFFQQKIAEVFESVQQ